MDFYQINKIVMCDEDGNNFEIEYKNSTELRLILREDEEELSLDLEKRDVKKIVKIFNYWLDNNKLVDLNLIN